MSAIWGIIDLSHGTVLPEDCKQMEKPFLSKKIDTIQTFQEADILLSCGLQFVSEEARKESYPYIKNGNFLIADAIIDNRQELQSLFSMESPLSKEGVDGSILFDCVRQNLPKALDAMRGAYVFAFYSRQKNTLYLANDVTGTRSVYYMTIGSRFFFSSLLEPLLALQGTRIRNDRWFFNYYAQSSLRFVDECRLTPYEGIFRLEPGELLTFSPEGLERKGYWNPLSHRKELKLPDHQAYVQKVQQVFGSAVTDLIRGDRDQAILLSGGLDSNAVAAFAAPKLREYGKKLYSFTSVPNVDCPRPVSWEYHVADERSYVELLRKIHPNLEPEWIGCDHFDYLKESRKAIEILEFPYKTIPNMPWMLEAYRRAAQKGCTTLLSGQYGNITISAGEFENLFDTLLKQCRFVTLSRQIKIYARSYRRRRRWVYGRVLSSLCPRSDAMLDEQGLNPRFCRENKKQFQKLRGKHHSLPSSIDRYRPYMYDKVALRQVGETELKLSLETGIIPRDPTRDKRVIELVMSLPIEQLCWDGVDRRLVRQDMEGLIPPQITRDVFHRGQQAVGADDQLRRCWSQIKEELRKEYRTGHAEQFLNLPYFLEKLDSPQITEAEYTTEIVRLIYCALCSEYLGSHYDK